MVFVDARHSEGAFAKQALRTDQKRSQTLGVHGIRSEATVRGVWTAGPLIILSWAGYLKEFKLVALAIRFRKDRPFISKLTPIGFDVDDNGFQGHAVIDIQITHSG